MLAAYIPFGLFPEFFQAALFSHDDHSMRIFIAESLTSMQIQYNENKFGPIEMIE